MLFIGFKKIEQLMVTRDWKGNWYLSREVEDECEGVKSESGVESDGNNPLPM